MSTELHTVDVAAAAITTAAEFDERVRRPWLESGVLLLRQRRRAELSPAQLVAFSRFFGELDIHSAEQFLLPLQREVLQITNRKNADGSPLGFAEAGRYWVRASPSSVHTLITAPLSSTLSCCGCRSIQI